MIPKLKEHQILNDAKGSLDAETYLNLARLKLVFVVSLYIT